MSIANEPRSASIAVSGPAGPGGPIILATDGRPDSAGAIRFAGQFAARWGVGVVVVAVPPGPFARIRVVADRIRHRVSAAVSAISSGAVWPVEIVHGSAPDALARIAARSGARLIVMGATTHDTVHRLVGHRTAIETAAQSTVPVMVVQRAEYELPHSALVVAKGVADGVNAMRLAVACLVPRGSLTIAHVMTEGESVETVRQLSTAIVSAIDVPPGIAIDTVALTGDPALAIERSEAERWEELVVVGLDRGADPAEALATALVQTVSDCSLIIF